MSISIVSGKNSQQVLFRCQRCKQHLEVTTDTPLQESAILAFQSSSTPPSHLPESHLAQEKNAIAYLSESFVVLPNKEKQASTTTWDRESQALTKIFEIASDKCQIDHALCMSCNEAIIDELDVRIREIEQETDMYSKKIHEVENMPAVPPVKASEQAKLDAEEKELLRELESIEAERRAVKAEHRKLIADTTALDSFEHRLWETSQTLQQKMDRINQEQLSVRQSIDATVEQLERLKRTNVFDDAFHIYYDGHFGTINGFRLGRLPSQPVDWQEINAALGQVILLLDTVARLCSFTFTKYKLMPMGSFSKIAKADDPSVSYELYGSNDSKLGKLFWYRRFDTAMVWLLQCVKEFGDHAQTLDPKFKLKYIITDDCIEKHSVKLQFNNDDVWTKAMKCLLTNLKYLLAWVAKHKNH